MNIGFGYRLLRAGALSALLTAGALSAQAQPTIDSKVTNFVLSSSSIKYDVQLKSGANYVGGSPTSGDFTGLQITWDFYIEPGVTVNMAGATSQINSAAQAANLTNATPLIYSFPGAQSAGSTPAQKLRINVIRVSAIPVAALNDLPPVYTTYATVTIPVTSGTPTTASRIFQRTTTTSPSGGSFWGNSAPSSINNLPITTNAPGSGGAGAPLPVELLSFTAGKASDGRRVQLDWSTATEAGCDYYEIERSASGASGSFASIGVRVKGMGTTAVEHGYRVYDGSPLTGMNYYRLRIVDMGGKAGYSEVRSVSFGGVGGVESVSFYPNPMRRMTEEGSGHLRVSASVDQSVSYTLSDGSGKLVSGGSIAVHGGSGSYSVEGLEGLAVGTYYLSAKGATINATLKIAVME